MKKNLIITAACLSVLFLPAAAFGQMDSRCFTKDACNKTRQVTGSGMDGFVQSNETKTACGGFLDGNEQQIGFCLAAGQTATTIAFGGRRDFANLGDFIQYIYKFAIVLGGILAVIMIIKSGFQWSMSAGSADVVKKAQDSIKKSLIGLLLLVFSYTILHNINPYLTELRLPQIWLLNTSEIAPTFCDEVKEGSTLYVAPAAETRRNMSQTALAAEYAKAQKQPMSAPKDTVCGIEYFTPNGAGETCHGVFCKEPKTVCSQNLGDKKYSCQPGNLAGIIYNTDPWKDMAQIMTESWKWPWISNGSAKLYYACTNNNYSEIDGIKTKTENNNQTKKVLFSLTYNFPSLREKVRQLCAGEDKVKGLFFSFDFNESYAVLNEQHFVGKYDLDLGNVWRLKDNIKKIGDKNLYSLDDMEKQTGKFVQIDAGQISDVDIFD